MNATAKGAVRSKTIYLSLAVGLLGYLEMNRAAIEPYVPDKWRGLAFVVLGATLVVVRFFTSETLAEKGTANEDPAQ